MRKLQVLSAINQWPNLSTNQTNITVLNSLQQPSSLKWWSHKKTCDKISQMYLTLPPKGWSVKIFLLEGKVAMPMSSINSTKQLKDRFSPDRILLTKLTQFCLFWQHHHKKLFTEFVINFTFLECRLLFFLFVFWLKLMIDLEWVQQAGRWCSTAGVRAALSFSEARNNVVGK